MSAYGRRRTGFVVFAILCLAPPLAASAGIPGCDLEGFDDRCEAWTAAYDNPGGHQGGGDDWMTAMEVDPDGDLVYVTGESWDDATGSYDIATQALDAATGRQVWLARYDSGDAGYDHPSAIAIDPTGETLVVAGLHGYSDASPGDYVTIAYDADTGAERWIRGYDGPGSDADWASDVTVEGGEVYVTGFAHAVEPSFDIATVAYGLGDGELLWDATHATPASEEVADSVVAADGKVYVGGTSWVGENGDYLALAYEAEDEERLGEQLWVVRHDGGLGLNDELVDMAVSRDGASVYMTGTATRASLTLLDRNSDIETVALDSETGERRWRSVYSGTSRGVDYAYEIEVGAVTGRVYVAGVADTDHRRATFGTIAYDGASGEQRWATKTMFVWGQGAVGIAVPPDESRIYVTGHSSSPLVATGTGAGGVFLAKSDFTTVAYRAADGVQTWQARYSETLARSNFDLAYGIGVAPDGGRVFVAGVFGNRGDTTGDPLNGWNASNDFGAVAYDA